MTKGICWYCLTTDAGSLFVHAYDSVDGFEARIQIPDESPDKPGTVQSAVAALAGHLIRHRQRLAFSTKH